MRSKSYLYKNLDLSYMVRYIKSLGPKFARFAASNFNQTIIDQCGVNAVPTGLI